MSINGMQKMASSSVSKWNSSSVTTKIVNNLNPICRATQQITLKGKFIITHNQSKSIPGKFISVQIYSGTDVDPGKCTFYAYDNIGAQSFSKGIVFMKEFLKRSKYYSKNDEPIMLLDMVRVNISVSYN